MKLFNDAPYLFLRMSNFNDNDFINEHSKIIKDNGYVWVLKMGRKINKEYLKEIIKNQTGLIIKKPSRSDNRLFYCKLESIDYDNSNLFPDYYYDFLSYNGYKLSDLNNNSSWFKISEISLIPNDIIDNFVVSKNENDLKSAALNSRTPYIFCKYIEKGSDK